MTKKYGIDLDDADNKAYEAAKEIIKQQQIAEPVTSEDIKFVIEVMKKEAPVRRDINKAAILWLL